MAPIPFPADKMTSAPLPKFVMCSGGLSHELRKQRGTSKYMFLVPLPI
jgi:hypothetical protein